MPGFGSLGQGFAAGLSRERDDQLTANAIAVKAIGVPRVPMAATAPAKPKLTPAPMKRPIDVQKANAVARAEQIRQPQDIRRFTDCKLAGKMLRA
jgi:hypothetical protein